MTDNQKPKGKNMSALVNGKWVREGFAVGFGGDCWDAWHDNENIIAYDALEVVFATREEAEEWLSGHGYSAPIRHVAIRGDSQYGWRFFDITNQDENGDE